MRPIRTLRAAVAAQFESLGTPLSSHRVIARFSLAALSFIVITAFSQQAPAQAGPQVAPVAQESLLPLNVGIAIDTDASITIPFDAAMDAPSVESALQVLPTQNVALAWNDARTALTITPHRLWRSDERYLVVVSGTSQTTEGVALPGARRFSFTTQTAPAIADFQVHLVAADLAPAAEPVVADLSIRSVSLEGDPAAQEARVADAEPIGEGAAAQPPTETATAVSASSSVSVAFSERMDAADVEERFAITPDVPGDLSWSGSNLVFTPSERLEPGSRYTISLVGAHDYAGNVLGGKGNFSFVVQAGAQLTKTDPERNARDIEPTTVAMWFSQPMNEKATDKAFKLTDTSNGAAVAGELTWNDAHTQLTFQPDRAFAPGRAYSVVLGKGARDADGNAASTKWSFTTKAAPVAPAPAARSTASTRTAPPVAPAPVTPPPAPASSAAGYAVNQINASRAAYGFAPVVLDASISAVAYAHAYDQAVNGYFSHVGRDGSTRETRLRAGGVSFSWSGENQCYLVGRTVTATLQWCHAQFMAEPYPGHWNHIANVLNPNARRVGVGIAQVGSKIVIVWDFTN